MQKDYGDLNIFNAIPLLIALIICIPYTLFFNKKDRRVAEANIHSLTSALGDIVLNCPPEEKELLKEKYDIILFGTYLDNPGCGVEGTVEKTKAFFKRNNIDLYSEDFDPEYVAKCIREQEIC